ncbi:MAG: hypothetical protein ACTSR8_17260 [Promethearchaeota archaeon]
MVKGDSFSLKRQVIYIIIIGAIDLILILSPNGPLLNADTDWRPVWSWEFYILTLLFLTFLVIIPLFILQLKIYQSYKSLHFRERWKKYFIGTTLNSLLSYGAFTYIYWKNSTYRVIWSFFSLLLILSAILIYYGIAQDIQKPITESA